MPFPRRYTVPNNIHPFFIERAEGKRLTRADNLWICVRFSGNCLDVFFAFVVVFVGHPHKQKNDPTQPDSIPSEFLYSHPTPVGSSGRLSRVLFEGYRNVSRLSWRGIVRGGRASGFIALRECCVLQAAIVRSGLNRLQPQQLQLPSPLFANSCSERNLGDVT